MTDDIKPRTLHLGVLDVPYEQQGGKTTGTVAEILESKYHVMETFYEQHKQEIADALAQALVDASETMMMGAPTVADPFGPATSQIEDQFKQFLSSQEMDKLGVPGVPTQAAKEGRSKRFKKGKGRGPRPSFIDTGTYAAAMKAWVD
jgi:hypothetical protein